MAQGLFALQAAQGVLAGAGAAAQDADALPSHSQQRPLPLPLGSPHAAPALLLKAKPPFPQPSLPRHPGGELVQTVSKEGVSQSSEKALQFTAQHAL